MSNEAIDEARFQEGIDWATLDDMEEAIRAALVLMKRMYDESDTKDALFRLRKSLEGIWGHDLP